MALQTGVVERLYLWWSGFRGMSAKSEGHASNQDLVVRVGRECRERGIPSSVIRALGQTLALLAV